ncbi:MAG: branched-chain amino acid ABC transporter permease [Desulfoferrobacter sp.]
MLIFDIIITGLMMGAFYSLMAVGLSLIFGILKVVNFAHGEFFMVGAYTYTLLSLNLGIPLWLALPCSFLLGAVVGWLTERLLMRPLYDKYTTWSVMRDEYAIIVTFGLSLFLINLANQIIGPYPYRGPQLVDWSRIEIGPLMISGHRFVASLLASAMLAAIYLFVRYSRWGKEIQAVAQNRLGASISGINSTRVSSIVFSLCGGIVAFSGGLLAPLFHAYPAVGIFPALKSYVVVVIGGMGSIVGSIAGGLLLGLLESFGAVYISYAYRDTFGFIILMIVLLIRPHGLFGEKVREV